ncbi:MAG: arsenate reductase family protein [Spirochaetota bacterium]
MIQIYGRKKCKDTKKAERFFSERRVPYQSVDLDAKAPGPREIELFAQVVGIDDLLDTGSKAYKNRGLAYMEFDPIEEIGQDPSLLRTPIVRDGREVSAGADEAFWKRLAERQKP